MPSSPSVSWTHIKGSSAVWAVDFRWIYWSMQLGTHAEPNFWSWSVENMHGWIFLPFSAKCRPQYVVSSRSIHIFFLDYSLGQYVQSLANNCGIAHLSTWSRWCHASCRYHAISNAAWMWSKQYISIVNRASCGCINCFNSDLKYIVSVPNY